FYLELEKRVFTAADQSQQLGARCLWRGRGEDVFLKGTLRGGFVPLVAAKSSASHLCLDGALTRPDAVPASLDSYAFNNVREFSTTTHPLALAPPQARRS